MYCYNPVDRNLHERSRDRERRLRESRAKRARDAAATMHHQSFPSSINAADENEKKENRSDGEEEGAAAVGGTSVEPLGTVAESSSSPSSSDADIAHNHMRELMRMHDEATAEIERQWWGGGLY